MSDLWWISWYQPGKDCRPLTWPPPSPILAYWCTGGAIDGPATLVALVRAPSADHARAAVIDPGAWPDAGDERFCDRRSIEPGPRFPRPTDPEIADRWPWAEVARG